MYMLKLHIKTICISSKSTEEPRYSLVSLNRETILGKRLKFLLLEGSVPIKKNPMFLTCVRFYLQ